VKAILLVYVVGVYLNLGGLLDHLVHVSGLGGMDGGVLEWM
jgi:hypothetical protein